MTTKNNEAYLTVLSELAESDFVTEEQEEALDVAQEALAFSQALWDLFADQALHNDGDIPDYSKMENLVDAINGELAAAVLLLCNNADQSARALLMTADNLEKIRTETVNEEDNVPQVVIEGNRRLAQRIKNTKVILNAKRVTKLIVDPKSS